jgi:glycosyltransferase involved in cell wall biosynthesis
MKVLWFEVTIPSKYYNGGIVLGGWQDSLEEIIRKITDVDLYVSFETKSANDQIKVVDGVTYIPLYLDYSLVDRFVDKISWEVNASHLEQKALAVVEKFKPDIIQVFGLEWPFGRISTLTNVPVVVHIMGSLYPYMNAYYAPGFDFSDILQSIPFYNIPLRIKKILNEKKRLTWRNSESHVWKRVSNYMGRTNWDFALSNVLHPGRKYFHVEEALRPCFWDSKSTWRNDSKEKVTLISTGCSLFWKGPDMILKTAVILKQYGLKFEWLIAGKMDRIIKRTVERKLKSTFEENCIKFLGFVQPIQLTEILCSSTMYVHTAYVENSPNSICEAQILGVPIVSTNVGGVSTIVGEDGVLIPANDPWQMANAIIELSKDINRMNQFSHNGRIKALARHNPNVIKEQLLNCYNHILDISKKVQV